MNLYRNFDKTFYILIYFLIFLDEFDSTLSISSTKILQDQKLMGDLYYQKGSNIHSLAWIIELSPNCDIQQILSDRLPCSHHFIQTLFNQSSFSVILLKKVEPFVHTYLIAHPYYKLYNKVKRNYIKNYSKYILSYDTCLRTKGTDRKNECYWPKLSRIKDSEVFLVIRNCVVKFLRLHPCVEYFKQEVLRPRTKRAKVEFGDPLYKYQWHLHNSAFEEYDVNVIGAWESGITGRGVTVCVIDDGLEWKHPDLRDNYNAEGSYDLNADDSDPSPLKNGENEHGTRCAGEIAAVSNRICGVGVAYRANISGVRALGERMTDFLEAAAFVQGLAVNDVYSCSWGPNDDGKTVDGPHHLAQKALLHGITYGRNGYGAIYVVASGNGGKNQDNCNFDGYANSIYTVTIGAVDSKGRMPFYAEECATKLAVMPSSGSNGKAIVTTDWHGSSKTGCTFQHTGTSAAAPLAAAVIALALEMQPCLSWRDVQFLIALTSRKIDIRNSDWILNRAGLHHSHQHGFGLMDATGIVSAAAVWESVPFSTFFKSDVIIVNREIPSTRSQNLVVNHTVEERALKGYALNILEYVQVYITLEHEFRGSLIISLMCPSGTTSTLSSPRSKDNSTEGLKNWPLGTVRCWGEVPWGVYTVSIMHTHVKQLKGKLVSMQIVLHGSPMTSEEFSKRRRLVKRALHGEVIKVNRSRLCHPPEVNFAPFLSLSEQTVQILSLGAMLLFVTTLYNTFAFILCYNTEKKKFYQHLRDVIHSRFIMLSKREANSSRLPPPSSGAIQDESLATVLEPCLDNSGFHDTISITCERGHYTLECSDNTLGHEMRSCLLSSPTPSREGDVSSLNAESDDDDTTSSRNTSDTIVPRDTDVTTTDFTTDHTTSEADELDRKFKFREYHS